MKKFLLVFGIFGLFFAGLSFAAVNTDTLIDCEWGDEESANENLQRACLKTNNVYRSAAKWIEYRDPFFLDTDTQEDQIKSIKNQIDKTKDKSLQVFLKGWLEMWTVKEHGYSYSELEIESMLIRAADFFEQAEKLERKPVISSGGILPGPDAESSGEDYLINGFLAKFINGSIVLLFSIGTVILIIGGLMFLFSSGDSELLTKAKDTIFWGIVGIIIAVMSYAIVKFIVGLDFGI